jgi:hypothetical protein
MPEIEDELFKQLKTKAQQFANYEPMTSSRVLTSPAKNLKNSMHYFSPSKDGVQRQNTVRDLMEYREARLEDNKIFDNIGTL